MFASLKGLGCRQLPERQGVFLWNGASLRKRVRREEQAGRVVRGRVESRRALWKKSMSFFNGGGKCLSIFGNVLKNVISSQGLSAGL